jgi:hypothetical protein
MKRTLAFLSLVLVFSAMALSQTSQLKSLKAACCGACCGDHCGKTCCQSGCAGDCCKGK